MEIIDQGRGSVVLYSIKCAVNPKRGEHRAFKNLHFQISRMEGPKIGDVIISRKEADRHAP
jgi:hypothetical protein